MKEKLSINSNDIELYGLLEGPDLKEGEKAPVCIMMHGIMTSTRQYPFFEIVHSLIPEGFYTLRFDFLGHGRSGGNILDMTLETEIEDAENVLKYVKTLDFISEIYLLGHSQGGVVASILGARHPNEIKSVIMLSPACNITDSARKGLVFGHAFDPSNPPELIENEGVAITRRYVETAQKNDIYEMASGFEGQVYLIYGDADERIPQENFERYENYIKNLEIHKILGGDHSMKKSGERVVELVSEILKK